MVKGLVSIIIPVYNVKDFIHNSLESVLQQSYDKIECIIIDDGSTDGSCEICKEYADQNTNIILIQGKHNGVSAARNLGLSVATGEYIYFLDADDYIEKDALMFLVKWLTENNVKIVCCGTKDVNLSGKVLKSSEEDVEKIYQDDDFLGELILSHNITCVCWGKLIRTELINNCFFDETIKIAEDMEWWYRLLHGKRIKVYYNSKLLHNWTVRETSATHNKKIDDCLKHANFVEKYIKENIGNKLEEKIIVSYQEICIEGLKIAQLDKDEKRMEVFKVKIKKYFWKWLNCKDSAISKKIKTLIKLMLY